jgi:nucleotide-binding universal stress UspA family protein
MYKRILVPLDGSDTAQRGLSEALGLARSLGATLHLLHVVADPQWLVDPMALGAPLTLHQEMHRFGEELLAKAAQVCSAAGVAAQTRLRDGAGSTPGRLIVEEAVAAGCNAIVMGTHGRKGVSRMLLGSDASWVVHSSPVPVLLVRVDTVSAG